MSQQLSLLAVPKSRQTRAERLQEFKRIAGIWTDKATHMRRDECPWIAILVEEAREMASKAPGAANISPRDLVFYMGEEGMDFLAFAETEQRAIEQLLGKGGADLKTRVRMALFWEAIR